VDERSHTRQVIGSLLVALAVVVLVIAVVTVRFGPTSTAELEQREQIEKERTERQEERLEQQEDARKEREDGR
jgi:hypothetical protein